MARNGSGAYALPAGNPVVTGTVISSSWANTTLSDIATALTNSIAKDGQTTPTANLPMGGYKHTGLGAGSTAGDSLRYEQLFNSGTLSLPGNLTVSGAINTPGNLTVSGAINTARGSVAMHAITMDLWAQPNIIDGTGSAVTITDIADAPQAGAVRTLYPVAGTTITDGATFDVDGNANYTTVAGDALIFEAVTTSTFKVHIIKADGTAVVSASSSGLRNRIINGGMNVDQRNAGAAQTFTAAAALAYCVDRWYGYCTGAKVTGQRVAGAIANTFRYRFTGAASNSAVGFGTRLEAENTAMMAGSTATLQAKLSSSSLTSITWTAYYANTKDTFGTLASPTRTQIATGTFTINSTEATYSTQISIPSAATTGIEIVFTGGALLGSQTLTIGDVQLEAGSVATPFEVLPTGVQFSLCEYYYQQIPFYVSGVSAQNVSQTASMTSVKIAPMRVTPTTAAINTSFTGGLLSVILNSSSRTSVSYGFGVNALNTVGNGTGTITCTSEL